MARTAGISEAARPAIERTWAQFDLAVAAARDVQHYSVAVERLVRQCDENVEDGRSHRTFRKRRLLHGAQIYRRSDISASRC
jgi:hypothetical protein